MADKEFGVTQTGFLTPRYDELVDQSFIDARADDRIKQFNPLQSGRTAAILRLLLRALHLIWQELEQTFYSAWPHTANGQALDDAVWTRLLVRKAAAKAKAVVTVKGNAGTVIPSGTRFTGTSRKLFFSVGSKTIPTSGQVDVLVEAEVSGSDYVLGSGGINKLVNPIIGVNEILNTDNSFEWFISSTNTTFLDIPADGREISYQVIDVNSLAHPHRLDEVDVTFKNNNGSSITAYLQVKIADDESGNIIDSSTIKKVAFTASQEQRVTFSSLNIDVSAYKMLRIVVINHVESTAAIGVKLTAIETYPNGVFVWKGDIQTARDLVTRIKTIREGGSSGGREAESDLKLRERFSLSRHRPAASVPDAIRARLLSIPDVLGVRVDENKKNVTNDLGLPPKSVRAIIFGGQDKDEIGRALFESVPAGIEIYGSESAVIIDAGGEAHQVSWDTIKYKDIYINVDLEKDPSAYPANGDIIIENTVIAYIGGIDNNSIEHIGLQPGDDVVASRITQIVLNSVPGLLDVHVQVGTQANPTDSQNIAIEPTEKPRTGLDKVTFS